MQTQFKTLLEPPYSSVPRELPVALGQFLANTKLLDPRMAVLNRLFRGLNNGQQLACIKEMRACKAAKRGEFLAVVQ